MKMTVLDPGHIYRIVNTSNGQETILTFVKRSGGAIFYPKEWPGIQTQAVMRALINYMDFYLIDPSIPKTFPLWQLGVDEPQPLTLQGLEQVYIILDVLIDRSAYLNNILVCLETLDSIAWFTMAQEIIKQAIPIEVKVEEISYAIRMALWCYEARAYRRKQEDVNRKQPEHDDSARLKEWRNLICEDVPFTEKDIEQIPIGPDGHIVIER